MTAAEELRAAATRLAEQAAAGREGDYDPQIPVDAVAALAKWLDASAEHLVATTHPSWQEMIASLPLAAARAINGNRS